MATKFTLPSIEIGVSYQYQFTWSTRDSSGTITPVDLSTWDGLLQVRKKVGDAVVQIEFGTITGGMEFSGNLITIFAPATNTAELSPFSGEFDLVLWPTDHQEQAIRLIYGPVEAIQIITSILPPTP